MEISKFTIEISKLTIEMSKFSLEISKLSLEIQSNLIGSNIFGTMEIRSKHG